MVEITSANINEAIVTKALNMIKMIENGFIYTNETICTFNSMIIFKDLFDNKCTVLSDALENLYFIADSILS